MFQTKLKFNRPLRGVRRIGPAESATPTPAPASPADAAAQPHQPAAVPAADPAPADQQAALQQQSEALARISQAIENRAKQIDQTVRDMRQFAVNLAMRIARAVISEELKINDARIRQIVDEALHSDDPPQKIRIHPDALRLLDVSSLPHLHTQVEWIPDETVAPGDCEVITDTRSLIVSLEQQLQEIEQLLAQELAADEH